MQQSGLSGSKVAFLATDGVEQVELTEPWKAVEDAGATPVLVSLKAGEIQGMNHDEKGDTFKVDQLVADAKATDFCALVLPGGVANPDKLRTDEKAVAFVRDFFEADKPVAAICHGPWMLVEAGALKGRTITSWPSLKTDVANAGGEWVDREVVIDQKLITSRKPDDIPAFNTAIVTHFADWLDDDLADKASEASFPASDPPPGPIAAGKAGE